MTAAADLRPSQKKVDKLKSQDAKKEKVLGKNKHVKQESHSSFL
jgi:hypothetical protein